MVQLFRFCCLFLLIDYVVSFQLNRLNSIKHSNYNAISMSRLKDVEVLDLLKTTDRGIKATKEDIINIDNWMIDKEQQYNMSALNDTKLYGYYDVSFVGTGKSQQGSYRPIIIVIVIVIIIIHR